MTTNTNLQIVNNRLVFGTQVLSDPSGNIYNLAGASDSSGNVTINIKRGHQTGLWQATIADVIGSYYWNEDGSLTSANLTVQKAVRK